MDIDTGGNVVVLGAGEGNSDRSQDKVSLIDELSENNKGNMSIADDHAKQGLIDVVGADRDFNVYTFLQASQDAFVYIVESFADGDRETLRDLLNDEVYDAFDGAIAMREKAGEVMEKEIQAIEKSQIVEAHLKKSIALITVRFWAQETSVTRDEEGEVVSGHPEKVTEMRDVWTFQRDLKSRDPSWLVVETREDGEGDNEHIPNTH